MNRVVFGPFTVDLTSGELRKHGVPIKLQEQPSKILAALLQCPGEVVSREELIKELWDNDTHVDYDRGLNAAINRLRQALSDSAESPRYVETVARRGYRFIAPVDPENSAEPAPPPAVVQAPGRRTRTMWVIGGVGITLTLLSLAWIVSRPSVAPSVTSDLLPVPLTSYEGLENHPTFSPDGNQVAFSWNGPSLDNFDIYVKTVGSDPPLRLTTHPAVENHPSWSPDGRYIAFARGAQGILYVAPTGGPERQIVTGETSARPLVWTPDGRQLIFGRDPGGSEAAGVFAVEIQSGSIGLLSAAETQRSTAFAVSPDARTLALATCLGMSACRISLVELDHSARPRGPHRQLPQRFDIIEAIAWTPQGDRLLITEWAQAPTPGPQIVLVDPKGDASRQTLSFAGPGSSYPTVSQAAKRLAYSQLQSNPDFFEWRNGAFVRSPLSSTHRDWNPQYSPDSTRVAFASTRSGQMQIWIASSDGSGAVQLTNTRTSGSPRWSPDGRWLAYDSLTESGKWDIMLCDSSGRQTRALITHSADDTVPSFSRDGKWIYFSSNRTGRNEVYRVPFEGGEPVQITENGGWVSFESMDGKSLFYAKVNLACNVPLFLRSLSGGPERQIIDSTCGRGFAVTDRGIYYVTRAGDSATSIRLLDPATGLTRDVVRSAQGFDGTLQLAVPQGDKTLLFGASRATNSDLYLVENFR